MEALEARVLLSADPVLGAVPVALLPDAHAAALMGAYEPGAIDAAALIDQGQSVVGTPGAGNAVWIGHADGSPVVVHGDLTVYADGAGGHVRQEGDLIVAGNYTAFGSGHTNVISGSLAAGGNYNNADSIRVSGTVSITSGGSIALGGNNTHYLGGNDSSSTDVLTLTAAATGNISFLGSLSAGSEGGDLLSSLTITQAHNVTFSQDVAINGNLTINATGIVTFSKGITLGNGGNLTVLGASRVVFNDAVVLQQGGSMDVAADSIDMLNGALGSGAIAGTGTVKLRPATLATPIDLFYLPGVPTTGALQLTAQEMRAFGSGFTSFTIGTADGSGHALAGSGDVLVGTAEDGAAVVGGSLKVLGNHVTVVDIDDNLQRGLKLGPARSLTLDARSDITLNNFTEADSLAMTSAAGGIRQVDLNPGDGVSEPLRGLSLTASALTGVSLPNLEINQLDVVNNGQGDIVLNENAARSTSRFADTVIDGTVTLLHLAQTGVTGSNGISLTSHAGTSITDGSARPGNITLAAGAGISLATDGALSLSALGTGSDINLQAPVSVHGGPVTLAAADAFTANSSAPITSTGPSSVTITSGTGALTLGAAVTTVGGTLTLNSAGVLDLTDVTLDAGQSGAIALTSAGDLKVGGLSAASSITLTSTGGAILDALTGNAPNLDGDAALATLTSLNGVGTAIAPLYTRLGSLTASVSGTSGGVFVQESTPLTIATGGLTTAGSGAIVVQNGAGDMAVAGPVHANGSGNILLEAIAGSLAVQSDVLAQAGSISLVAGANLALTGTEVRTRGAGQTLDLRAGFGVSASLSVGATTLLATAGGAQRLQTAGAVTLGSIDAGSATVTVVAGAAVTSASQSASIVAGSLRVQSGGDIGTGAAPLQIKAANLAASGAGSLAFNEVDDVRVGSVAEVAVNRVGTLGTVTATTPSTALAGLTATGGSLVLNAGGAITLDTAASAGGHLRLSAATSLDVNAAVSSSGGQLTLLAGAAITHAAAGGLSTAGGAIDEQASAALSMAATTTVNSNGGRLRLQSGGVLTPGQLNAGSGEAWMQGTRISSAAGAGVDLVAGAARLLATGTGANDGIASSSDALSLQVQRLAVQSAGLGGVYLSEADDVLVDSIAASSGNRVQADGTVATLPADATVNGLAGLSAPLVLSAGGSLATLAGVNAQRVRLSAGSDLGVNADVVSADVLSLSAARDITMNPIALTAGGSLDWVAGRDLFMQAGTVATAQGASSLQAGRDVRVGQIDVGSTRALTVNAGGSLRDPDVPGDSTVNLKAGKLVLIATAGIGVGGNAIETTATYLGASSGGGIYVTETDGLSINGALGTSFGSVQRVAADGSLGSVPVTEVQGLSSGAAAVVLRTLGGALTVDAAVQTQQGHIRLESSGALALNAGLASNGGIISLLAGGAVTQAAAGIVRSSGGAVDLQAAGAWTMAQGSLVSSGGSTLRLSATGALALAELDAGSGLMSITASQVKDLTGDDDTQADLTAGSLMLRTTGTAATDGVGAGSDLIEMRVPRLAVATAGGGVFLSQLGGAAVVDSLAAFTSARTGPDGAFMLADVTDAALAGITSSGSFVLLGAGDVTLGGASTATGAVLITSPGSLSVNGALSGLVVSLNAGADLLLNANVSATGSTRSVDLVATRDITQGQGVGVQSANGVIALQAGRDITIETLNAGIAGAALIAGGAILDGDAAGDTETDITAGALRLTAGGDAGTPANALETSVTTLSGSAASLSLAQVQALAVDRVTISLQRVGSNGGVTPLELGPQEDLTTATGGALLLTVNSGDLTINAGTASPAHAVTSGGALLLRAVTGSVAVKAGITAAGNASLRAGGDLSFNSAGNVTLAGASSLDAEAGASLTMADGAVFTSGSGSLRLAATLNLAIGALQTGGDVSLLARNITDAGGAETDITARALRVQSTGTGTTQGFGTGAAPLQLQVATLAASVAGTGAGGFFAREVDALAVDAVGVSTTRVGADGSTTSVADAALSDLVSAGNVVLVTGGSLSLTDGGNADGLALQSGGNVLLDVTGDLSLGAALRSTSGVVSLLATGSMALNAGVAITRTGRTLDVQAGGAVTMAPAATLAVVDAAIRVQAGGDLTLGGIASGLGQVSLISTGGSIVAASGHTGAEVSTASLRLSAAVGIGRADDRLETTVQRISARAAGGGIWLQEADGVTITDVAVSVRRVSATATTAASIDDATQSDLVTTGGNGSIALATTDGNIVFADGTAPLDGRSVTADGTGTVSLKAGGATAFVNLPAGAIQQQGPVTIDSALKFDGAVTVTAGQGGGRGDGPVTISGAIDGTAGGAADRLVVASDGADVVFGGAIGAVERLGGLAVSDARNISFAQDVKLAGDLTLQASGKVEFKGGLDLSSGSLSIVGATELVIGNVVVSSGSAVIHVDALTLSGLITGSAAARVELAGASGDMAVGGTGAGLAIGGAQLAALQGFGEVQLGRSDLGTTRIDVATLGSVVTPHLTLAGGTLALQGAATGPNAGVQLLDLAAGQDLTLAGRLALTAAGADVHAAVGGALRMNTDGVLATQGGDVQVQAGGDLRVGRIDTRGAGASPAAVVLASTGGTISEANGDAAVDVYADLFTLRGRGPALAGGASEAPAALDVQANTLDVDAPRGVVLRDSGSNGLTAFNLLDGGQVYQLLTAQGTPVRQPSVAAMPAQPTAAAADAWAWLNALRPLAESRDTTLASGMPTLSMAAALDVAEMERVAAVFHADPAPLLPSQLAALLNPSSAAAAAEAPAQDSARFRVWSEELVL
nr:LEPR-XLL domain-containing protein [Pelomonas sp. P8]